jgi:LmbE family N-acetylglucosaminyl deacetylase
VLKILGTALVALTLLVAPRAQARELAPLISPHTRLLVFSPHPDDGCLGAAGLIRSVLKAGGRVQMVYMTNGDGFPAGVEKVDHLLQPTATDYRSYGAARRGEALKAMSILGVKAREVIFLGFPDGGLAALRTKFLAGPIAYRSPFTLENRPPATEIIIPQTKFTGDDLTREIARVITDFRPNLVATTPPEDWHPDHRATYFFVTRALTEVWQQDHQINPLVLAFLVHYGPRWPEAPGAPPSSHLIPPKDFTDKGKPWVSLPLTPAEVAAKTRAIRQYATQMAVMGKFLLSFGKSNELFLLEN